jgi:hypothetical protein
MNDWLGNFDGKLPDSVQPADFAYWCRASQWELEEAVHIALGAEPKSGQGYVLVRGRRSVDRRWKEEPFVFAAERLTELVQRRFHRSRGSNFVKPGEFVSWMGDAHLPVPHELSAALARFGDSHTDWKQRAETAENEVEDLKQRNAELETAIANQTINGSASTKEKDSLLKLIIGMAVVGYSYDPHAGRSGRIKEIEDDLLRLGLSLSDDTIRKHLRTASELLPGDWDASS